MAKFSCVILDSSGNPQSGQAVKLKLTGTSTIVASTVGSETGGSPTIVDMGNGQYMTTGTYSPYISSGDLRTGAYDLYKGSTLVRGDFSHIAETDITGALQAADNLSDVASAATARENLGLEIGVDVEAYDASNALAAAFIDGWLAVGDSFPFCYYDTGANQLAFGSASTMRTQLGLGTAALLDAEDVLNASVSTSAPPTASSDYAGKVWIRNSSTEFSMYVCVRTGESTYSWRKLRVANSGGTDDEDVYYTYGGA